jgi:hypothetical protein
MALFLADSGEIADVIGGWPIPKRGTFVASEAYHILARDLRRYVRDEIPGRSFLISGHRGSGKTALVTRVVEDLRSQALRASLGGYRQSFEEEEEDGESRTGIQRPLFVKLHGPSLLASTLPGMNQIDGGTILAGQGSRPAEAPSSRGHVALVQLTIALYRALSEQVAEGFAAHAAEMFQLTGGRIDRRELAAQLALELDSGPDPGVLRAYWDALLRLKGEKGRGSGVLWPRYADETLIRNGIFDQGYRELIAVSTAAQAYRKSAGREEEKLSSSDEDKRETTSSSSVALTDVVKHVGAVLSGTIAGGFASAQGPLPAFGVGLGVWLLSGVALSWSSTRTRRRDRVLNYSYIRDRSEGTLERDLPGVIRRIQRAGLSPVFILDELDKLPNPRATITEIIDRLKHLVTDHGFFCFLADRNYFDEIQRAAEIETYPPEHTYFSERLLILYRPENMLSYLLEIIRTDLEDDPKEGFARVILALKMIQRSKLNFADLTRAISAHVGAKGRLEVTADAILRIHYRLAASMQLAIDEVMRAPPLASRLDSEPAFAQLAVDALYMVSRCWEEERSKVDLSPASVREYLERRMRLRREPGEKPVDPVLSEPDLHFLVDQIRSLCLLLADWDRLRTSVARRTDLQGFRAEEIVPRGTSGGLLKEWKDGWHFECDISGRGLIETDAASSGVGAVGDSQLVELARAFSTLVEDTGVSIGAMAAAGILPATFGDNTIGIAAGELTSPSAEDREAARGQLRELKATLDRDGFRLGASLLLVDHLRALSSQPLASAPFIVERLSLHVSFRRKRRDRDRLPSLAAVLKVLAVKSNFRNRIAGDAVAIEEWKTDLLEIRRLAETRTPPSGLQILRDNWHEWQERVEAHLAGADAHLGPLSLPNFVAVAAGHPPGSLFRTDLTLMTVQDWSRIVVDAMRGRDAYPAWAPLASLTALRFSGRDLALFGQRVHFPVPKWMTSKEEEAAVGKIVSPAHTLAGLLFISEPGGGALLQPPLFQPVFGLDGQWGDFREELALLASLGLFKAVLYEPSGHARPAWPDQLAKLPLITVSRDANPGPNAPSIDSFGVNRLEKVVEAYELRARAIAAGEWKSASVRAASEAS